MAKPRAHTLTHTNTERWAYTHTHTRAQWHMQSSLFVRLFELREVFFFARRSAALGTRHFTRSPTD